MDGRRGTIRPFADDVCFSSIDPHPKPNPHWSLFSAAGRNHSASRARGGIRTNQVHTRVRFAPAGSRGLRRRCPILSVSIHFASLRPLDSTLFSLPFFIRSQLPIIYCTYFAAYFPTPSTLFHPLPRPPSPSLPLTVALIPNPPNPNPSFFYPHLLAWYLIRAAFKISI